MRTTTFVTYNGITFDLVSTPIIERLPVLNEAGEYLYTRVAYRCKTIYHPYATSYNADGDPQVGIRPAVTDDAIRKKLEQPQKQLEIKIGSDTLIKSPQDGYTVDANNGPKVLVNNITKIVNTQSFDVDFVVETAIIECPSGSPPIVISNRYHTQMEVDRQLRTTRVYNGLAVFRTDALEAAAQGVDHYRNQLLPPVPLGYQRKHINITTFPARNALAYTVVDVEQFTYIGGDMHKTYGVTEWEGNFFIGTARIEGAAASGMAQCRIEVRALGERDTTNWNLMLFCIKMAYQKLGLDKGLAQQDSPVIRDVQMDMPMHDRRATLVIEALIPPQAQQNGGLSILNTTMLKKNDADLSIFTKDWKNTQPYDKGTRGSDKFEAFEKKLREACEKDPGLLNPIQAASDETPYQQGTTPVKVKIETSQDVPYQSNNKYTNDSYATYKVDVHYQTDYGLIQAPIAGPLPNTTSTGSGNTGSGGTTTSATGAGGTGNLQTRTASIIRLHQPMSTKTVKWTCTKVGSQPTLPNPESRYNPNEVLAYSNPVVIVPELMPDGSTVLYQASGVDHYYLTTALKPGETLTTGVLPWTNLMASDNTYSNFSDNVIDHNGSSVYTSGGEGTGGTTT